MNLLLLQRCSLARPPLPIVLHGALMVGLLLLLAGCGQGSQPGAAPSSAAAASPAAPAAAPASAAVLPAGAASAAQTAQQTAAAKAKLSSMSVADLLAAARGAYAQHHLVAPAGDNAIEYYEAVLAKDPGNRVASDALRETFPFSVPEVESAISNNNFDEAGREIDLLAKADPTNYTLTLLRSKLDAQKKLQARQQAQQQQTEQLAAQQAQARAEAQRVAAAAAAQAQAEAARTTPAVEPSTPVATPPVAAAPVVGVTRGVQVVKWASPTYPAQAVRMGRTGFVVVQFVVEADGGVTNAHVTSSRPRRVFDAAAIRAIERSQFQPALRNNQPVSAVVTRRIDFKLGG